MQKINKFLNSLTEKERESIEVLVARLYNNDLAGLNVKKLKGSLNMYRVRKGDFRIVFSYTSNNSIKIEFVGRRNDNTYKKY